jgi:hypothetical protein
MDGAEGCDGNEEATGVPAFIGEKPLAGVTGTASGVGAKFVGAACPGSCANSFAVASESSSGVRACMKCFRSEDHTRSIWPKNMGRSPHEIPLV